MRISLAAPAEASVAVRAQRSIGGRLTGSRGGVEVRLRTAGRSARTDGEGRFLFRQVAAGPDTVEATVDGRVISRDVLVPDGPAVVRDVQLDAGTPTPAAAARSAPAAIAPPPSVVHQAFAAPRRDAVLRSHQWTGAAAYGVQLASYPNHAEAEAEASRLAAAGGPPLQVFRVDLGLRGVWHRVLVVGFADGAAAETHRARVQSEGREVGPVFRLEGAR